MVDRMQYLLATSSNVFSCGCSVEGMMLAKAGTGMEEELLVGWIFRSRAKRPGRRQY